ncbi:methionine adenosyltransferase domain-containing protein, partial [Candidatus Woesearchaeota archaeon]|nr:methionine adenosyltransferase domain-containing protein [Candidatus Woesearchaeota archaeon]
DLNAVVHAYLALNAGELFGDSFFQRNILINGAGAWQDEGGWKTDKGTRDAKPQEAYFGSHGVAEDVPWGEDPTKPSGTGSFLARYIANQVVGNGLADVARVTLVYKIGQSEPRINIFTNGTGKIFQQEIERWVERELVDLSISGTIDRFFLRRPELYKRIVQGSDLFHDYGLPWNKVDLRYREK